MLARNGKLAMKHEMEKCFNEMRRGQTSFEAFGGRGGGGGGVRLAPTPPGGGPGATTSARPQSGDPWLLLLDCQSYMTVVHYAVHSLDGDVKRKEMTM